MKVCSFNCTGQLREHYILIGRLSLFVVKLLIVLVVCCLHIQDAIYVILSGTVEGVVEESVSNKSLHPHPLGQCFSISQASGRESNLKGGQHKCATTERLPFACMLGPGSAIGTGHFLAYLESMPCRAHTEVKNISYPVPPCFLIQWSWEIIHWISIFLMSKEHKMCKVFTVSSILCLTLCR